MSSKADQTFEGRTALVTGAGHGLGRDFALGLARSGASVVVNDIGSTSEGNHSADVVVEEIRQLGGRAVASHDSIGDTSGAVAAVERTIDEFGTIDVLINNAGIIRDSPFEDQSIEELEELIAVHLRGAFAATQRAYRQMKAQSYGRIVSMTSSSGVFGLPTHSAYGSAKTGLLGMTTVVGLEGAEHDVLANTVLPMATTNPGRTAAAAGLGAILGDVSTRMTTDFVTPLVLFLASQRCSTAGNAYSALAGRYSRVATVLGEGWVSREAPSLDEVAEHFAQISDIGRSSEPQSLEDEVRLAVARVQEVLA